MLNIELNVELKKAILDSMTLNYRNDHLLIILNCFFFC